MEAFLGTFQVVPTSSSSSSSLFPTILPLLCIASTLPTTTTCLIVFSLPLLIALLLKDTHSLIHHPRMHLCIYICIYVFMLYYCAGLLNACWLPISLAVRVERTQRPKMKGNHLSQWMDGMCANYYCHREAEIAVLRRLRLHESRFNICPRAVSQQAFQERK